MQSCLFQLRATWIFTICFFSSIAPAEDAPPGLLPEKIDIPGIVTNATGEPIANADVDFIERSADVSGHFTTATVLAKTTSDSTGQFLMKDVTITKYRINYEVRATADGYAYHSIGLGLNGGQSFFDFWRQQQLDQAWIVLVPAQRLAGTVVDETGAPIAGAKVSNGDESYLPVTTGADGKFAFDRTPVANVGAMHVERHLFITHPDYASVELRDLTNHPIIPGEQTVTLTHGIRISGQITASDTHKPLEDMPVSAEVPHSRGITYDARTDATGQYAIRVPRPRPTALPVQPGGRQPVERQEVILHFDGRDLFIPPAIPNGDYVPARKDQQRYLDVTNAGDEVQNVDAQYEPNLVLRGTIQMADGSPVPESTQIQAIPEKGSNASGSGWSIRNVFAVGGLSPGMCDLEFKIFSPQTRLIGSQKVTVADLPQPIVVTLSGAPATSPVPQEESVIHGAIHDSTGLPARLAYLRFAGGGYSYSDLNGNYRVARGRSREDILWVWSADMQEAAVIDVSNIDPAKDYDVKLQPAAQVSGFIHDPSGQAVPNVNVMLSVKSGSSMAMLYMTATGADGKYSINGILSPPAGTDVVICPMPEFDRGDHFNTTIAQKPIPADLTAGQKLDDFDFTVDLSQPLIHVTADPERH